jgi:hypothetical protein
LTVGFEPDAGPSFLACLGLVRAKSRHAWAGSAPV